MGHLRIIILLLTSAALNACTIYKSPDRKDFEERPVAVFDVASLNLNSCSNNSVKTLASASRLVSIENDQNNSSVFIWEHSINGHTLYESENLMGTYCLYENN